MMSNAYAQAPRNSVRAGGDLRPCAQKLASEFEKPEAQVLDDLQRVRLAIELVDEFKSGNWSGHHAGTLESK